MLLKGKYCLLGGHRYHICLDPTKNKSVGIKKHSKDILSHSKDLGATGYEVEAHRYIKGETVSYCLGDTGVLSILLLFIIYYYFFLFRLYMCFD